MKTLKWIQFVRDVNWQRKLEMLAVRSDDDETTVRDFNLPALVCQAWSEWKRVVEFGEARSKPS